MADAQKEAFRAYLEKSGVIDIVTKVLVALYEEEEKPKTAEDYFVTALGAPTAKEYEKVLGEKKSLEEEVEQLQLQNQELHAKVAALENPTEEGAPEAQTAGAG